MTYGFERACRTLEALGVRHVFGVPGTQSVHFFEGLRRSRLETILTASELGASFAAGAYGRIGGAPGVMVAIPGPGFAYALPGLAEAKLDSAPMVLLTWAPRNRGRVFDLQGIDQRTICGALAKDVVEIADQTQIESGLAIAFSLAQSGEPGPVVVQFTNDALADERSAPLSEIPEISANAAPDPAEVSELHRRLCRARRAVLFVGQGAAAAADAVRSLAETLGAPVLSTPSGRGIVPEDHPLAIGFDVAGGHLDAVNALLDSADLILVLGAKLGHNGSAGFALRLPPERLVRVDSSAEVLDADYPASLRVHGDVGCALAGVDRSRLRRGWSETDFATQRAQRRAPVEGDLPEPRVDSRAPAEFFASLRSALPREAVLVTDSGLHQILTRRHYEIYSPNGLLMPNDFQSMGFGLPAALGAKLAAPERPVVALIGDGSLGMTGFELGTAVREKLPLAVIVFHDGSLNLIRTQQLGAWGHQYAVALPNINLRAFADAMGASYCGLNEGVQQAFELALSADRPTLIDVQVTDSAGIGLLRASRIAKESVRTMLPRGLLERLRRPRRGSE